MKLTLNKAAKISGKSKSTLLNAIKKGKMSAPKNDNGHYEIDASELSRAFPPKTSDQYNTGTNEPLSTTLLDHLENKALEREIELLKEMLAKSEENEKHWREMALRQQALLEDRRPRKRWLWSR